jgi:serine/threonine-protein kinase RsbW
VIEASSKVRLELNSRPESPALVRAALTGVADLLDFESELLDDLLIAVSEACNNVVLHAYDGQPGPLVVGLEVAPDSVQVTVQDWGSGIRYVEHSEDRMGVGLAVMSALADHAEFISTPDVGTEVRLGFTGRGAAARVPARPAAGELAAPGHLTLTGDVVATLSPAELLRGVLGRVARAVAARTSFSLDRLSDVSLATDAIASFARAAANGGPITFGVIAARQRIELLVGPVRAGCGEWLQEDGLFSRPGSPLALLAGELSLEPVDAGAELLRVVVDEGGAAPAR